MTAIEQMTSEQYHWKATSWFEGSLAFLYRKDKQGRLEHLKKALEFEKKAYDLIKDRDDLEPTRSLVKQYMELYAEKIELLEKGLLNQPNP